MEQTKLQSKIEAIVNSVIGYIISVGVMIMVMPLFDVHITPTKNMLLVGVFTIISIIRNYIIRRWFNHMLKKASANIATKL